MARTHAEHVAEITFPNLCTVPMLAGAGRERLQDAALRMEHTGSGIRFIVRGPHLVAQFGDPATAAPLDDQTR